MKPLPKLGSFTGFPIPAAAEPHHGVQSHLLKDSSLLAACPFPAASLSPQPPCHMQVLLSGWGVQPWQAEGPQQRCCHRARCHQIDIKGSVSQGVNVQGLVSQGLLLQGVFSYPRSCTQCWESRAQTSAQTSLPSLSHIGSCWQRPPRSFRPSCCTPSCWGG